MGTLPESARTTLTRLGALELDWCLRLQQRSRRTLLCQLLALISRLGDGIFWYALILGLLVVDRHRALPAVSRMVVTGGLCLTLYTWLKNRTSRPRPHTRHAHIDALVAPLDEFSFPSGHTLHAVAFSTTVLHFYPGLSWLLLPFTLLVALSRPILGLHYPSDVLAGAALGLLLALLVLQL